MHLEYDIQSTHSTSLHVHMSQVHIIVNINSSTIPGQFF